MKFWQPVDLNYFDSFSHKQLQLHVMNLLKASGTAVSYTAGNTGGLLCVQKSRRLF
jgi:hypothetical protein